MGMGSLCPDVAESRVRAFLVVVLGLSHTHLSHRGVNVKALWLSKVGLLGSLVIRVDKC